MRVIHKKRKPATPRGYIKRPTTVLEVLDIIDTFLASMIGKRWDEREPSRQLWDILTALRGPDNSDNGLKMTTTSALRSAAFPKVWMATDGAYNMPPAVFKRPSNFVPPESSQGTGHFRQHIKNAYRALLAIRPDAFRL